MRVEGESGGRVGVRVRVEGESESGGRVGVRVGGGGAC